MRFLIGLVTGATLTLFMATAVDAPTDATLDRARAQLERLWESLIDTTSDSLFGAAEAIPAGTRPAEDGSAARPASPFLPAVALEAPPEMPPALPAQAPSRRADPVGDPPSAAVPADLAEALAPVEPVSPADPARLAAVWVPFHSQMSAEGFAARLSRELDHAFRVERRGAGSYQVVFDAETAMERELLLAQIAEITGQ